MSNRTATCYLATLLALLALSGHATAFIGWTLALTVLAACAALLALLAATWAKYFVVPLFALYIMSRKRRRWLRG